MPVIETPVSMPAAQRVAFTFPGDLSASRTVRIGPRPDWATKLFLNLGWLVTVGSEAVGALKAVILGDIDATSGADYPVVMVSPAGTNDGQLFTIDLSGAPAVDLVYTRTSGSGVWTGADSAGSPTYYWSA